MESYLVGLDGSTLMKEEKTEEETKVKKSKEKNKNLFDEAAPSPPKRTPPAQLEDMDPTGIGISVRNIVIGVTCILLVLFAVHCTWVTSNAYR